MLQVVHVVVIERLSSRTIGFVGIIIQTKNKSEEKARR